MPQAFKPAVVTANHLMEGDVIYLTEQNQWTRDLAKAEVLLDEADADLRLLFAQSQPNIVVGAYLAQVDPTGAPTHFREDFRRTGPSNYFHGKQADQKTEQAHV